MLGLCLLSLFIVVARFTVCVVLEALKAGLACKPHIALHVVPWYFSI